MITLIIVLFLSPHENAACKVNFDFDAPHNIARLCLSGSQS
jgi:hypothetical protein